MLTLHPTVYEMGEFSVQSFLDLLLLYLAVICKFWIFYVLLLDFSKCWHLITYCKALFCRYTAPVQILNCTALVWSFVTHDFPVHLSPVTEFLPQFMAGRPKTMSVESKKFFVPFQPCLHCCCFTKIVKEKRKQKQRPVSKHWHNQLRWLILVWLRHGLLYW